MVSPADRLVLVTKFSRVDASTSTLDQRSRLLWKPLTSPVGRVMLVTRPSLLYLAEQLKKRGDIPHKHKCRGHFLTNWCNLLKTRLHSFSTFPTHFVHKHMSAMIYVCNYAAVKDTWRW